MPVNNYQVTSVDFIPLFYASFNDLVIDFTDWQRCCVRLHFCSFE